MNVLVKSFNIGTVKTIVMIAGNKKSYVRMADRKTIP